MRKCATNRALNDEIQKIRDLKVKAEGNVLQLEALFAEKDENLKSVAIELERTQKILRLLITDTSKLDHLITSGKSFGDHSGVGSKGESFGTKTVFVKSGLLDDSVNVSINKSSVKSVATESKSVVKQSVVTGKSVSDSRQKRKGKNFVPICNFCGVKCHIRPRCFTLMTFLENNHKKTKFSRYFQKVTPIPKIDLGKEPRKM